MNNILRNVLIGVGLLVVVVGYTYFQVSTSSAQSNSSASLGSDMPLDKLSENETVPQEKLSKTDVYLKDESDRKQKEEKFDKMMAEKNPQKLTSNFDAVYASEIDKKANEVKERDLTPGYSKTANKVEETNFFEASSSSSPKNSNANGSPKIMKSSVPTNRKVELQPIKEGGKNKEQAQSDESYFNMSSNTSDEQGKGSMEVTNETTMVKAAVVGTQVVKNSGVMRFRLLEKATFGGTEFERNTVFFAKCSFGQERLFATVEKIKTKAGFKTIKLVLHDMDLMEGITAPVKETNEAALDETMNGVEDVLSSTGTVVGQAGSGLAKIFRSSAGGVQKVTVSDAYPVLFVVME